MRYLAILALVFAATTAEREAMESLSEKQKQINVERKALDERQTKLNLKYRQIVSEAEAKLRAEGKLEDNQSLTWDFEKNSFTIAPVTT